MFLAHHPSEGPRRGDFVRFVIDENDAMEFDCQHFRDASPPDQVAGGTGFFRIESSNELVVAAVYTVLEKSRCNSGARTVLPGRSHGTDCHGAGVSMDVEYITPKVKQSTPNQ
jgi:hypothetical protein